ncbi:MAG: ORF6N domain-containing protein [Verrucomicrobiota bacterium]
MNESISTDNILQLIHTVRGQRVILAADLARLYRVQTKRLNEQIRRNRQRFPSDFVFQLTRVEALELSTSQIAILKRGANIKHCPTPSPSTAPSWPPTSLTARRPSR